MDSVIADTPMAVFSLFSVFYDFLPGQVKYLLYIAFGGVVVISILRGIGR